MSANGSDKRILSAQVDSETATRLERLAAEEERTLSGEIRVALRSHLARASRPRAHVLEREKEAA